MDAYIGEIRLLPFAFAPTNWLTCSGQLLSISQYQALFTIIGTRFGGNGSSNFALPNFQSFAGVGAGAGAGLTPYVVGQVNGTGTVNLITSQIPVHTHNVQAANPTTVSNTTVTNAPAGSYLTKGAVAVGPNFPNTKLYSATTDRTTLAPNTIGPPSGAIGAAHDNHQPYLALQFCICVNGIYPTRP